MGYMYHARHHTGRQGLCGSSDAILEEKMTPTSLKVAARYTRHVQADSIGDIPKLIRAWERLLVMEDEKRAEPIRLAREAEEYLARPDAEADPQKWEEMRRQYSRNMAVVSLTPKFVYEALQHTGMTNLFLAILQQYSLPPALRKKVEAASRIYGKRRVLQSPKETALKNLEKFMASLREHLALAQAAVSQGKSYDAGDAELAAHLQAGPFQLVNTGGFDEKTMKTCADVVEEAARLIQAKGFGKVCYGQVLISNTIGMTGNGYAAFYMTGKDEMFVRANLRGIEHKEAVRVVVHELGHRLEHVFLKDKRGQIAQLYEKRKRAKRYHLEDLVDEVLNDPERKPKPGDTLQAKGETWTAVGISYGQVNLLSEDKIKAHMSMEAWIEAKGFTSKSPSAVRFVTNYASRDAGENFAEMFSFYCFNILSPTDVTDLEVVLG